MADKFAAYFKRMDDPLDSGEVVDYGSEDHVFTQVPRALNCSAAGTLVVDMSGLTAQAIYVVAGLNPYRVTKIYSSGSDAMTVVGMW
jgi:hypothetical protein